MRLSRLYRRLIKYQITIKRFLKKGLIDDTAEQQSIAVINSIVISMIIKHSSASKLDPVI